MEQSPYDIRLVLQLLSFLNWFLLSYYLRYQIETFTHEKPEAESDTWLWADVEAPRGNWKS